MDDVEDLDEVEGEPGSSWADPATLVAVEVAARNSMPPRALATYARWWQLETWLRELVYVELRAKYGAGWTTPVAAASGRLTQDAAYSHMENADSKNPLAYLDYSQLLDVISSEWELFAPSLVMRSSWEGRQTDLKRIRHRIGHMRRPHPDDLGRLEQTLRDLERGTFIALASYNERFHPEDEGPVTAGWLKVQHRDARRLVRHADEQYETRLILRCSRRPWAKGQAVEDPAPGILWHADFLMRGRTVEAAELWRDTGLNAIRPLIVHLVAQQPWSIQFTFSGADSGVDIANAIGDAFDALLITSRVGMDLDDHGWGRRAREADFRVINGTGWNVVDETTLPISSFGAGSGVHEAPTW